MSKSGIKVDDRFYSRLTIQRQDSEEGITRITTALSVNISVHTVLRQKNTYSMFATDDTS